MQRQAIKIHWGSIMHHGLYSVVASPPPPSPTNRGSSASVWVFKRQYQPISNPWLILTVVHCIVWIRIGQKAKGFVTTEKAVTNDTLYPERQRKGKKQTNLSLLPVKICHSSGRLLGVCCRAETTFSRCPKSSQMYMQKRSTVKHSVTPTGFSDCLGGSSHTYQESMLLICTVAILSDYRKMHIF